MNRWNVAGKCCFLVGFLLALVIAYGLIPFLLGAGCVFATLGVMGELPD